MEKYINECIRMLNMFRECYTDEAPEAEGLDLALHKVRGILEGDESDRLRLALQYKNREINHVIRTLSALTGDEPGDLPDKPGAGAVAVPYAKYTKCPACDCGRVITDPLTETALRDGLPCLCTLCGSTWVREFVCIGYRDLQTRGAQNE